MDKLHTRPAGYYCFIKLEKIKDKTAGGLIIAEETIRRESSLREKGTLVAWGPTAFMGFDGIEQPEDWGPSIGDTVEFRRYETKPCLLSEIEMKKNGEEGHEIVLVKDNDIVAYYAGDIDE